MKYGFYFADSEEALDQPCEQLRVLGGSIDSLVVGTCFDENTWCILLTQAKFQCCSVDSQTWAPAIGFWFCPLLVLKTVLCVEMQLLAVGAAEEASVGGGKHLPCARPFAQHSWAQQGNWWCLWENSWEKAKLLGRGNKGLRKNWGNTKIRGRGGREHGYGDSLGTTAAIHCKSVQWTGQRYWRN